MKRSYFVFYGYAIAYCISMLFAWQIGNLSTTSLAVQNSTASPCCLYKSGNATGNSERDKIPAVSNTSLKINKLYANTRSRYQSLLEDVEILQQYSSSIYIVEDHKDLRGFHSIIEFPDKVS
ncbi:hypothetical protein ACQWU4_17985 [Chryseobacterium sp. MIQD13]|uniref:hypothetical protein n=1 Tax=Chryseobacterium sp. MIQD13 TaxID=3422310 RepID=UPI003D285C21